MKIGIVTLTGYYNYGNRLQNFASQQVLKSLGAEVETIEIFETLAPKDKIKKNILRLIVKLIECKILPPIKNEQVNKLLLTNKYKNLQRNRMTRIQNWSSMNIKNSKNKINNRKIPKELNSNFDYFITGSDQVWNPYFIRYIENYFLDFADPNKRISYAASFGVSSIPDYCAEKYSHLINQMNFISVRETAGKDIVEKLTNKKAQVVIDPTMMLDKNDWLQVSSEPKNFPEKKYVLTYTLGKKTKHLEDVLLSLKKERNLEIIDILDPINKDLYCVDPGEFIYLINNAEVMITDSFHGAVFSIIMKTPFVIFEREDDNVSMNSRITTLTQKFNMEDRLISKINSINDIFNIDFTEAHEILKKEQEIVLVYLKNALNITH